MTSTPQDIPKETMLRSLGYGGDVALYNGALETAGLSNPRKSRIATSKIERVNRTLAEHFFRVCNRGDCAASATRLAAGRAIVPAATQADCEVCGGSKNRSAVAEMVSAFRSVGWTRLVVVGGSPTTREELAGLIGDALQFRLIDGTRTRTLVEAESDLAWADLVVIWASTELSHKVSELYTGPKAVTARSRGVAILAQTAEESARRAAAERARHGTGRHDR